MSLVAYMNNLHGTAEAACVSSFFRDANMPVPEKGEFTPTSDKGFIVFLDKPALVLRGIRKKRTKKYNLPNLLRSVLSRDIGNLSINLYPGIRSPITTQDTISLIKNTAQDGYVYWDAKPANAGYLPFSTPRFPHGVPIVIDQDAVRKLSFSCGQIRNFLRQQNIIKEAGPALQDDLFIDIKESFHEAWPAEAATPDLQKLEKALKLCVAKSHEDIQLHSGETTTLLCADWQNMGQKGKRSENHKNAKRGGALYAQRWGF